MNPQEQRRRTWIVGIIGSMFVLSTPLIIKHSDKIRDFFFDFFLQ